MTRAIVTYNTEQKKNIRKGEKKSFASGRQCLWLMISQREKSEEQPNSKNDEYVVDYK